MQNNLKKDEFTKGMNRWDENDDASVENYTIFKAQLMKPFLGEKVLEIGAGTGTFTAYLNTFQSFKDYVAIEPSLHFYNILKTKMPQVRYRTSC